MGRGGYNGGSPIVVSPKKDKFRLQDDQNDKQMVLPEVFRIVGAGEGLKDEHGVDQYEFGYLIDTIRSLASFVEQRQRGPKFQWMRASILIAYRPADVRLFHQQNPAAARPYELDSYTARTIGECESKVSVSNDSSDSDSSTMSNDVIRDRYERSSDLPATTAHSVIWSNSYDSTKTSANTSVTGKVKSKSSPSAQRCNFGSFINSMDDLSFAYFSLIREYALRTLQGNALLYANLYKAMLSQNSEDEERSRCSVIEFLPKSSQARSFPTFESLKAYIDSRQLRSSTNHLFILEDLPVRYVCLLGSRFKIHPTVFASHYSTEDTSKVSENIMSFPSISRVDTQDGLHYADGDDTDVKGQRRRIMLRYPIVMPTVSRKQSPDPSTCPPWFKPSTRLTDQSAYPKFIVERSLDTPTLHSEWDARGEVSELEGQVTYCSNQREGGVWQAVLLVDPCLKDPTHLAAIRGEHQPNLSRQIRHPELEDHEKVDLAPGPTQWHPSAAFTKYILHDDILTHFSVAEHGPGNNPLAITPFIRGFVISKSAAHLNHVRRCFSHTRAALFRSNGGDNGSIKNNSTQHTARWGANWEEWLFESITRWITDLVACRMDVETNMRALGIDIDDRESTGLVGKREAQMWRYIRSSYLDLQGMFESLAASYTQVMGLREAQASNKQADGVRWMTILGTLFVPVSIVSGIMSMGGDFLPGEDKFWVFFAVVIPFLVVVATFVLLLVNNRMLLRKWRGILREWVSGQSGENSWNRTGRMV